MINRRPAEFYAAFLLMLVTLVFSACAGGQGTQHLVVTEYLLKDAGFKPWDVNDTTPKRQAILNSIPRGKIVTFKGEGGVYHVYADEGSKTLYVGDEAAYQKYLGLSKGRQLCERVDATANSAAFWSCFDEAKGPGGKSGGQ